MKITKITLENFRGYEESFELDLDGGKNLLLHGENGSGKSSLYLAFKRLFEERGGNISSHRNRFSDTTRSSSVRIHLKGPDSTGIDYDEDVWWDDADGHPLTLPKDPATAPITRELRSLLVDAARRSGFLDYRTLLRTNLLAKPLSRTRRIVDVHDLIYGVDREGAEAQLFDVVTWAILDGVRVTTAGGGESTIGNLIRNVWLTRPQDRYKRSMRPAEMAAKAFNHAFAAVLPELEKRVSEYLDCFEKHELSIKFESVSIEWDKKSLSLDGAVLIPKITFRGQPFDAPQLELNEARLSAIAICLFLAGVHLSDNDYTNPAHPRFLFLDDALIGLELQNRLPILRILARDEFKHYQIFLLTHDRVWFDLAQGHLPEKDDWLHKELLADEDTGRLIPKLRASESDLARAKHHLANGDLKAAAVYARSAFEWKLRKVCQKNGIKVPFQADADKVGAGVLWDGIVLRQREREEQRNSGSTVNDFVPLGLEKSVETMRSTVLNRLSHAGSSGLVAAEVAAAIQTVEAFYKHQFPKAA